MPKNIIIAIVAVTGVSIVLGIIFMIIGKRKSKKMIAGAEDFVKEHINTMALIFYSGRGNSFKLDDKKMNDFNTYKLASNYIIAVDSGEYEITGKFDITDLSGSAKTKKMKYNITVEKGNEYQFDIVRAYKEEEDIINYGSYQIFEKGSSATGHQSYIVFGIFNNGNFIDWLKRDMKIS